MNNTSARIARQIQPTDCVPSGEWQFLLPRQFQPLDILPAKLAHRTDEARFYVNAILRKMVPRKADPDYYARMDSRIWRQAVNWRASGPVLQSLVDSQVFDRDPYSAGCRCYGYRLNDRFLSDRHTYQRPVCPILRPKLAKMAQLMAKQQGERTKPIHVALRRCQDDHLTIDASQAKQILDSLPPHTRLCQGVLIENIARQSMGFSIGSTDRLYNAITGLKRELRHSLRIDGERVASIDLKCSQPTLLALLLKHPSADWKGVATYVGMGFGPLPSVPVDEWTQFVGSVCRGTFYELLTELTGLSRDEVKRRYLIDVLAPRARYPSVVRDAFTKEFPSLASAIRLINKSDHGELIRKLQRLEAWLVIHTVAPKLIENVPIVTLHDSIFASAKNIGLVEQAFNQTFEEIGFTMKMKVEHWNL